MLQHAAFVSWEAVLVSSTRSLQGLALVATARFVRLLRQFSPFSLSALTWPWEMTGQGGDEGLEQGHP